MILITFLCYGVFLFFKKTLLYKTEKMLKVLKKKSTLKLAKGEKIKYDPFTQ